METNTKAVAAAMLNAGLGANGLAEKARLNLHTVYRMINGKKVKPSTFHKVAHVLGVKPSELAILPG